jgi:hypothetical protein
MIDPDFNPYDLLEQLKGQVKASLINQARINESLAQQLELNRQMIDQINFMTDVINSQNGFINELHDRLQLIEIARQYDNNKTTTQGQDEFIGQ